MTERWERRSINPLSKDMYQKKNLSVFDDNLWCRRTRRTQTVVCHGRTVRRLDPRAPTRCTLIRRVQGGNLYHVGGLSLDLIGVRTEHAHVFQAKGPAKSHRHFHKGFSASLAQASGQVNRGN